MWHAQQRIWGMAGMARAMGEPCLPFGVECYSLKGAQNFLSKN